MTLKPVLTKQKETNWWKYHRRLQREGKKKWQGLNVTADEEGYAGKAFQLKRFVLDITLIFKSTFSREIFS